MTENLIYVMKRGQTDIKPRVLFLFTMTSNSDKDDWKNLCCLIGFVKGAINDNFVFRDQQE